MNLDDATKARFLKGLLLTWVPFVLIMGPFAVTAVQRFSARKAAGLGAVAGGFSEWLTTFGFAAVVFSQLVAIVLLARSFDRRHAVRGFFSAVSICCSLFLLACVALNVWILVRFSR